MQDRIVEFSNILRRNGVRVSLSENVDAFRALELLGIEDPWLFRDSLRATLVKRATDLKTFEELFDLFFLGMGESLSESDCRIMAQLELSPVEFQRMLEQVQDLLGRLESELTDLTRALLAGDLARVERLLKEAAGAEELGRMQDGLRLGAYSRMVARLAVDRTVETVQRLKAMLLQRDEATLERISRYLDQRLTDLRRLIRDLIAQEQRKQGSGIPDREQPDYLSEKSFSYYTEEDIRRMNDAVARLARRLKNRLSVRRKRAAKGRFDVKDTLRKNMQYGGVPFQIQVDRRKKEKPEVVVLCDISDSVLNASRFMLQFVYSVQDLYSKVRSFVFVSDIGEVTRLFEENEICHAVETALKGDVVDVYTHSNFGRAFELFYHDFPSTVTGKTTVLIIGDGRNNYNRPNDWVLRELQQKAKQIIWLNPESRLTWGIGDSEMPRYAAHCDVVEECRNIRQLYKVIDLIVP